MGGRGGAGHRAKDGKRSVGEQLGLEQQIQQAYRDLAPEPGDWVSLTALRGRLAGIPHEDVDRELRRMISLPNVSIVPEVDQTLLSERDRRAAVRIGGEWKHAIAIDVS